MYKNFRKLLSLILVLALLIPNMVFAEGVDQRNNFRVSEEKMRLIKETLDDERTKGELVADYNDEDIVRIIVELEEKPVIVHATESGQRYEDMSYSQRTSIKSSLYSAHEAVKNQISARNINMVFSRSFTTAFNGFSGEVQFQDIETIKSIKGVKNVYISNEYERPIIEPNMGSSHGMIGSKDVWLGEDLGYKGEGMVVAIIDSGVDPSHKDFVLSEDTTPKLLQTDVEQKISEGSLSGKYFTDKVPYGYNYYDLNHEILDLGPDASEHGMHVAGTVTANGDIKGVAPESQVLAMKVFSNDPIYATTFDDIYLVAIDEAIELGADVVNMSLGSTASFYVANSAIDTAITNATTNGIVCSISAGNSGHIAYGLSNPYKEDPDYGVVGSPSLSKDSISVASIENDNMTVNYLEYAIPGVAEVLPNTTIIIEDRAYDVLTLNDDSEALEHYTEVFVRYFNEGRLTEMPVYMKFAGELYIDIYNNVIDKSILPEIVEYRYTDSEGVRQSKICSVQPGGTTGDGETVKAPMSLAGPYAFSDLFKGEVEFVDGGSGHPSELGNVAGKVALIIRGGLTPNFTDKIENAEAAGASGVIVYNHEAGGEDMVNMAYPPSGKIPAGFIGHSHGMKLVELKDKLIKFPADVITVPNTSAGTMSDFSSWGTTPTLELKPEITAPGGMIYSTLQNDKYGVMSGTSMAAPHLSGGAALVMQYIKENKLASGLDAETRLAKALLMNTAGIVEYQAAGTPYSPRKQGSGLMNLKAAVTTPVYVTESTTGEAKVELKDFDTKTFTMNLKAINLTDEEVRYNIEADVFRDWINASGINLLALTEVDAEIGGDKEVTVPAGGEKAFTVTVDFSQDQSVYENMFVDGWVKLTDQSDTHPELSVPFVGFYGDWDEPRILDKFNQETDESTRTAYGWAGMLDTEWYFYGPEVVISPGTIEGDYFGTDTVLPVITFLRNAEKVEYNILDEDGIKIRTIRQENYVRKSYVDNRYNPYSLNEARTWDGKARNQIVDDGLYYYQIRTKVQNGDWQEKRIPVTVDTVGPEITNVKYNQETGKLTWDATDKTSEIQAIFIDINGKAAVDIDPEKGQTKFEYDLKDIMDELLSTEGDNIIEVYGVDMGMNIAGGYDPDTQDLIEDDGNGYTIINIDEEIPYIYLETPELLKVYDKKDVVVSGYVLKNNEISSVIVDGEEVEVEFSNNILHTDSDGNKVTVSGYIFNHILENLDDGYHAIKVEAESINGTKADIVRRFYVDATDPEFGTVTILDREVHARTADIEINMSDNFPFLNLYVFDSLEFIDSGQETAGDITPINETITVTVDLVEGENIIPLKLIDAAGNVATTTVKVDRIPTPANIIVDLDKEELEIEFAEGDSADQVTTDLVLPVEGKHGSTITWESSNEDVIGTDGTVTLPAFDTEVTLTATIEYDGASDSKEFFVTVIGDSDPIEGSIDAKYGKIVEEEDAGYIVYIQFSLKDKFKEYGVDSVRIGNETLEAKPAYEGYDYRYEGYIELAPEEIVITINGVEFNISTMVDFELMNEFEVMELIESM